MVRPRRLGDGGEDVSRHAEQHLRSTKRSPPKQRSEPSRQARWQASNPRARWAHVALASGLRRGLVQREPCAICRDCWAAIETTHHLQPRVDERRFQAYLVPFPTEEAARRALVAEGCDPATMQPEQRRKRG